MRRRIYIPKAVQREPLLTHMRPSPLRTALQKYFSEHRATLLQPVPTSLRDQLQAKLQQKEMSHG